jgi:glycogen synthase
MSDARIALVSREVYPFGGGGIGNYVNAAATVLSELAEVTVITTAAHESRYQELQEAGDPRIPEGVRYEFVPEPQYWEVGTFFSFNHLWSARAFEALCRLYGESGPDVVEFSDYLAEGFVTCQAKRTSDPRLRETIVCIRLHTSAEMCAVLDGHLDAADDIRQMIELERYALRFADRLIWPGGDVLATYARFYGDDALAPATMIRYPYVTLDSSAGPSSVPGDGALRMLYMGRLERRKGVQNLIRAVTSLDRDDWTLTLVGGDTRSAPLGVSMRDQLELMSADDPRIRFVDGVPRESLPELLREHHLGIVPSRWECWPFTGLETLEHNRPLIGTPTGGLVEMVQPGRSGWRTRDTGVNAIADTIEGVLETRDQLESMVAEQTPHQVFTELTDTGELQERYRELIREARSIRPAPNRSAERPKPLVSAILPYFQLEEYVVEALGSIFEQTYERLEVIVVNDGSLRERDWILAELATRFPVSVYTQQNSGLGAARNFGISQCRGRYVFPLDADNVALPAFVERCVEALERDPEIAYVTSWSRYIDERGRPDSSPVGGYQPIGNSTSLLDSVNVAGDATAVIRRRVFELGISYSADINSYEDWLLYRRMRSAGLYGHVIPERLLRYRVRGGSMVREFGHERLARLAGEMDAQLREDEIQWTSSSA